MSKRYSLPFKTVIGAEIVLESWHYRIDAGEWLRADSGVAGWDYLTQLEFYREMKLDGVRVRSVCDLEPTTPLELIVTAHCPAARFRRVAYREAIPGESWERSITFAMPSQEIAEGLRLETEIILMRARPTAARFSARYLGSRLFSESVQIDLEGVQSRMPLEYARFSQQLPWLDAPMAPWYVDCGTGELHAPVMRDLRVFLNSDQPAFVSAAQHGDIHIIALLKAEIARQLLQTALADDEFLSGNTDYEEGTLGQAAIRVLRLCFRDRKPAEVLNIARQNANRFQAMLISRFNHNDG
jgi:hypothetical protein